MSIEVTPTNEFDRCLALRMTVFVKEQNVPEEIEIDEYDAHAIHFIACEDGRDVGTARVVRAGADGKIGRVCVLKEMRGRGVGKLLINAALEHMKQLGGMNRAVLGAQLSALDFYRKLGFTPYGPVFNDAGIDHKMMEKSL